MGEAEEKCMTLVWEANRHDTKRQGEGNANRLYAKQDSHSVVNCAENVAVQGLAGEPQDPVEKVTFPDVV